jgi:predicted permease
MYQDLSYALRMLRKTPTVTIVAVLSLALGIGANTAIFSLLNALMLRTLPVHDPQQLVAIASRTADSQAYDAGLSLPMFEEIRKHQQVFSSMFLMSGGRLQNVEANGVKFSGALDQVDGDYFSTLGVQPLLGRLIAPSDLALDSGSPAAVAVIGYRCWQERYNGDPAVIEKTIRIEDHPLTIVGVTPENFVGLVIDWDAHVTVPIGYSGDMTFREGRNVGFGSMGRLKHGVTLEQARAQPKTLWSNVLAATVPSESHGTRREGVLRRRLEMEAAATGTSYLRQRVSYPLFIVMGLVGLVLLIACVNLANLMLARAASRRQEFGIRLALGAGAWRLIRQLLTESVLLSVIGALLGLAVAFWASRVLMTMATNDTYAPALNATPDVRVLAFTAAVAVLTGVLFGLSPAWQIKATTLQQGSRSASGGTGALGALLVAAQVAFSLILVIGATLFVRSLGKLRTENPGFRREGVLVVSTFPQTGREHVPNRAAYYQELTSKLAQLPGVESVGYSNMGPAYSYELKTPVLPTHSSVAPMEAVQEWVGPGFFHMIGMRLLAGREFDWRDDTTSPPVAIVSESLARRLFPNTNPIGQKIDIGTEKGFEIAGVVNSASLWKPQSREPMAVYYSLMQQPEYNGPQISIRVAGDPMAVAPSARRILASMGTHFALHTETLEAPVDRFLSGERMIAVLSTFFGGRALLLASVGLYGLMSYAVTRRTSEIGIRMALGAQRGNVLRLILREVSWLVLAGLAVGIPVALAASRLISGLLFGISATDPVTIASSAAILLTVALFAGYLPARRASRIDPMTALRSE